MADGKVLLEVVVEGKNVKVVQREVEGVTDAVNQNTAAQRRNSKATSETSRANEHYDRGLKGLHQTNLSASKGFSKMRDVMGGSSGLVGAYATLAANLFAATAAFGALQKAAQVQQLTEGLTALGMASGLAMGSLSANLQKATGYAISLQDAMRQVAMVTSAGFDPSIIERLGTVAKNTSIALGRDLQDSMNRLVKGATKLEPELLDELGIMVRIDEATQMYAKEMGKTASQLTNFEKRQAFMNAVLAEGEKKFGALGDSVDANPYDRLSAKLQELSASVLNAFNVVLAPIANFLADNEYALAGLIAALSKGIIGQALPILSELAAQTANFALGMKDAAVQSELAAKKDIAGKKAQLTVLNSQFGAFGKTYNASVQNAKSLGDWKKIEEELTKSIAKRTASIDSGVTKNVAAARERIAALEAERKAIQDIIDVEKQRAAGTYRGGPGIGAGSAKTKARFATRSADILSSLDMDASFENYRKQTTRAIAAGNRYRASMAANGAATTGFASKIPLIGSALGKAGVAFTSFGLVAKIAIKGIFTAIPIIGQFIFVVDLLIAGLKGLFNLFKSDASKKYEEQISTLTDTYKELNDNSKEVNKAFAGVSSSITTQTQAISSQFNIISSASAEFGKTFESAMEVGDFSDLIDQTETLIDSNNALKKSFQEKIKVELEGKDISTLSDQQRAKFLQEFLKEQNKAITSQTAYNDAVKETGDQLTKYFNSITTGTPLDGLIDSFINLGKAEKALAEDSSKAGNQFSKTKAIIDNFGQQGLALLGLSSLATQFTETTKKAESFSNIIEGLPQLKGDVGFWSGMFGGNDDVLAKANAKIEEINKNLKAEDQIPLLEKKYGSGAMKGQLDSIVERVKKLAGQDSTFVKSLEQQQKLSELINNRTNEAIENYTKIFGLMTDIANEQTKLNQETAKQSQYVLLGTSQLEKRMGLQKNINNLQIQSNEAQISELQQSLSAAKQTEAISGKTMENTMNMVKIQGAINNLSSQNAKLTADVNIAERDRAKIIAENTLKNIQEMVGLEKEFVSILQKQSELLTSNLGLEEQIAESRLKLQNLVAGGKAEVTIDQQLKLLKDFEDRKAANAKREYDLKIRTINLEEKIARAQLAVAAAQLQAIIAGEVKQRADNNSKGLGIVGAFNDQEFTDLINITQELKLAAAENITGVTASLQKKEAQLQYEDRIVKDQVRVAEISNQYQERGYALAIDAAQQILSANESIEEVYDRINSSRSSILDSEKQTRENELKAINLRESGKYELTAQQTLELETDFANKKAALIKEEESRKLRMIALEFKLLEAQTRFQQYQAKIQLENLKDEANRRGDTAAVAEITSLAADLDSAFTKVIAQIPEAAKLAQEELVASTKASLSDLDASKLIKDRSIVLTTTVQTIMPEAGQLFDPKAFSESIGMARKGAMQDQLGPINDQMKSIEEQRAKLLDSDVIDLGKYTELGNKLKELNNQRTAISTGEDPFANIKMGIAGAGVALAPFIESLKTLGPQGELVASIASGTLVMADSISKFAESSKTAADKFALVGAVVSSVASIIGAASAAKVAGIDAEINAEKQRDGKSKESLARIASMEKKKESAKRKAFETNKKMMMATTIINTAAAAMAAWAPPPTGAGPLFGGALTAMIVALGAAQLGIIAGMSYEGGGGSISAATPSTVSLGQRKSSIDMAKSQSAAGELGYLQGDKGVGGPENFRPAFIGSRAAGGRVNAGYMVGEQGPELFVPKLPGRIVPADKVNNAPAQNVNISITALDAAGVEEVLVKQRGHIIGMIREAANSYGEKFLETVDTTVYTQPSKGYGVARA